MTYKVIIENDRCNPKVYLFKKGWFGWKMHQYDIPVSYSYFRTVQEVVEWFHGNVEVYPDYFTYLYPITPTVGLEIQFDSIEQLHCLYPEYFI